MEVILLLMIALLTASEIVITRLWFKLMDNDDASAKWAVIAAALMIAVALLLMGVFQPLSTAMQLVGFGIMALLVAINFAYEAWKLSKENEGLIEYTIACIACGISVVIAALSFALLFLV